MATIESDFLRRHKFFEWWQMRYQMMDAVESADAAMGRSPVTYPPNNFLYYVYNANHPRNEQMGQLVWHDWRESGDFVIQFPDGGEVKFTEYDPETGKIVFPSWLKRIDKTLMTNADWDFLEENIQSGIKKFRE